MAARSAVACEELLACFNKMYRSRIEKVGSLQAEREVIDIAVETVHHRVIENSDKTAECSSRNFRSVERGGLCQKNPASATKTYTND